MVEKRTGLSRDLIIHPGETIEEILEMRGISQAELAARTGVSAAYISSIISGKKNISSKFAMSLEYALGVSKSFWLNLQANYDAELLEFNAEQTITEEEKKAYHSLAEVVKYLKESKALAPDPSIEEGILSLRKILQVSNLDNLKELAPQGAFRIASGVMIDPFVLGAWLRLTQISGETHTITTVFSKEQIPDLITEIKRAMSLPGHDLQKELAKILAQYGIQFSVMHNFRGAPVHGYISQKKDGSYQMTLTIRGAYADIFWFSLFHELGHIVNGDITKGNKFIDGLNSADDERERNADAFARDALLEPKSYSTFLAVQDFSYGSISRYATTQGVKPYIVIGRLQKEGYIPYNRFSRYKVRYKWAGA